MEGVEFSSSSSSPFFREEPEREKRGRRTPRSQKGGERPSEVAPSHLGCTYTPSEGDRGEEDYWRGSEGREQGKEERKEEEERDDSNDGRLTERSFYVVERKNTADIPSPPPGGSGVRTPDGEEPRSSCVSPQGRFHVSITGTNEGGQHLLSFHSSSNRCDSPITQMPCSPGVRTPRQPPLSSSSSSSSSSPSFHSHRQQSNEEFHAPSLLSSSQHSSLLHTASSSSSSFSPRHQSTYFSSSSSSSSLREQEECHLSSSSSSSQFLTKERGNSPRSKTETGKREQAAERGRTQQEDNRSPEEEEEERKESEEDRERRDHHAPAFSCLDSPAFCGASLQTCKGEKSSSREDPKRKKSSRRSQDEKVEEEKGDLLSRKKEMKMAMMLRRHTEREETQLKRKEKKHRKKKHSTSSFLLQFFLLFISWSVLWVWKPPGPAIVAVLCIVLSRLHLVWILVSLLLRYGKYTRLL